VINFSDFDRTAKHLILEKDWCALTKSIEVFQSQLTGIHQQIVFNSLMKYYSLNHEFYSKFGRNFINITCDMNTTVENEVAYSFNKKPSSRLLIISPKVSKISAGIKIFQKFAHIIQSIGLEFDELFYSKDTNLDHLFTNLEVSYDLIIIPETVSHIPNLLTKNILVYHGNKAGFLPQVKLGSKEVDLSKTLNYVHSKSIDTSMKRLFFNTVDFEKFRPTQMHRKGGSAIYLGKFELHHKSNAKLAFLSKKFKTNLVITRNFPETESLPSFCKELGLLVTLDPISSTNLEFAAAGCPVLFVNFYDFFGVNEIKKYELFNDNIRFHEENDNLLDFSSQVMNHNYLSNFAHNLQEEDTKNFISHIKSLVGNRSLPSLT
jgi:hypothetical protein